MHPLNLSYIDETTDTNELKNGQLYVLNRVSSYGQHKKHNHIPKISALKQWCEKNSIKPIKSTSFVGSATLDNISDSKYFHNLKKYVGDQLQGTKAGTNIFFLFSTIDRLIRPAGFDARDKGTWELTDTDFEIFRSWLNMCFGDRVQDINFLIHGSGTPEKIRGQQTAAGMEQKGNMGGRPRKRKKAVPCKPGYKKQLRNQLFPLVRKLAEEGYTSITIKQYLEINNYCGIDDIAARTIRSWAKSSGIQLKKGRPLKSGKNQKVIEQNSI